MQYDVTLPREVKGDEIIEALKRVASKNEWPYKDDVMALSVYPASGSIDTHTKIYQSCWPETMHVGYFS